jgi:hypothetical protein
MDPETIKNGIATNQYTLKPFSKTRHKSVVWDTMYSVYDSEDNHIDVFVACINCESVLTKGKDSSTKNLLSPVKKCAGKKNDSLSQTTISKLCINIDQAMAIKNVKPEHKTLITTSLSQMSVLDFRPFSTCMGVGFRMYSQNLVDIASKHGRFKIEDVLPLPSTISRNVKGLFQKAMFNTKRNIQESYKYYPFGFTSTTDLNICKTLEYFFLYKTLLSEISLLRSG